MIRCPKSVTASIALLAACGSGTLDRAALHAAQTRSQALSVGVTAPMTNSHQYPAAVVLDDGRVLVADNTISETYDRVANKWTATGTLSFRFFHALVKLADGRVLAAGGEGGSPYVESSAQIFSPQTGTWTDTSPMTTPRSRALAARLADGRVLLVGGWDSSQSAVSSAELYDPAAGSWAPMASANHPFQDGTATLLADGRVLLVGPYGADVFNAATGTFAAVGTSAQGRFNHVAGLLTSGKVLLTAGSRNTSEIFDPSTNSFSPTGSLGNATRMNAAATVLSDGSVLVAGGYDNAGSTLGSVERYDTLSGNWSAQAPLAQKREYAKMVLLASGQALAIGGGYRTAPNTLQIISPTQAAEILAGVCAPTTCAAQNATCGSISDGCGTTLTCGSCGAGQICNASNACVCAPTTCAALGAACGSIGDGCGGTLACGSCGPGQACNSSNACVCAPTTCAALGAACGSIGDGCGGTLTCGSCGSGQTCIGHACVPAPAQYDSTYKVPRCTANSSICDSGTLLVGRAGLGPEANAPNTIGSTCADGTYGTYHVDESLDRLVIQSLDGTNLTGGNPARISATVWAYSGFTADRLDLYSSPGADSPSWTLLATLTPAAVGSQTLSTTITLPFSATQAIRGVFRFGGSPAPCSAGMYDDHDDLVFSVVVPPDTVPPTVSITAPSNGASITPPVQVTLQASDDRGVAKVELYEGPTLLGSFTTATASITLYPVLGSHTYKALAYDAAGNVGQSAPVTITAVPDTTPPVTAITYPNPGQTVSGNVIVNATASDNVGVVKVEFYDGSSLFSTSTSPPWNGLLQSFSVPNGSHTLTTIAYDGAGNTGTSAPVTVIVNNDHTPPSVTLTSPAAGSNVAGVVTLTAAATDNVGVTRVEFWENGQFIGQGAQVAGTSNWTLYWDTTNLIARFTVLTLTARAYDAAGNNTSSASVTVTENDTVPPTTAVISPVPGATLSGTVTIVATASDNVGVTRLAFYDGAIYLGLVNSVVGGNASLTWNTRTVANGNHSLFTMAYDAAGNIGTSATVNVTVNNDLTPPSTSLDSPVSGATVQGTIALSATATDDVAVQTVRFWLDGTTVFAVGTQTAGTTTWTGSWNTNGAANGSHTLTSQAIDTSGNYAMSVPVAVTVSNIDTTPPTTSITSPSAGATLSGSVTLWATASDNVGVTRVDFWDSGAYLGSGTQSGSSYSFSWNTATAALGSHSLSSRAYDAANNVGFSPMVPVTVVAATSGTASYDATRKAPACAAWGSSCDSGTLLNGRGSIGPELNAPNTIASSCADGAFGAYHSDESLDRLKVSTLDGGNFAAGKAVRIDATVWAYASYPNDHLDLYYAADAASPTWILIGTLNPTMAGANNLSASYTLPAGAVQAVRGVFRYVGSAAPCTAGGYDDHDDLVFATQ